MEQLVDMAATFKFVRQVRGANCVVIGSGGGASVLAADDLATFGIALPPLPQHVQDELAKFTHEAGTSVRNPVDSGAIWDPEGFRNTLMPCAKADEFDFVLFHTGFGQGPTSLLSRLEFRRQLDQQVNILREVQVETGKPIVVSMRDSTSEEGFRQELEFQELCARAGLASYHGIDAAGRSIGRLITWQRLHEGG
jgi:acyl-CoA synthetase (NDP forming)